MDIFDNVILCKKCNKAMKSGIIEKNGFELIIQPRTFKNKNLSTPPMFAVP